MKYKKNLDKPERGINSIQESFERLNLNYIKIDSTDSKIFNHISESDVIFNYVHGEFGEDGRLQGVLDYANKPYIGSGVQSSVICNDKLLFKKQISYSHIPTPRFEELYHADTLSDLLRKCDNLYYPVMLKLKCGGSSIGITKVNNATELNSWFSKNQGLLGDYFIEKWIDGKFLTIGVINFTAGLTLLPALMVVTDSEFYDESDKLAVDGYGSKIHYKIEDGLSDKVKKNIFKILNKIFSSTICEHFGRIDFMIDSEGKLFVLEINTVPGIARNSNMIKMLESLKFDYDQCILSIMRTAYDK